MLTTKTDNGKVVKEVTNMIKYDYPNRSDRETHSNKRRGIIFIEINVFLLFIY